MRRIARRAIKVAGVISGVALAWLVQPLFLPPYTAHARVAVPPGEGREFFHRAGELLGIAVSAQIRGRAGSCSYGTRRAGRDALEAFATTHDHGLSLAVVSDWTGRMLDERPGLPVLVPPMRDRFEDPAWPTILIGAVFGWLAASKIAGRNPVEYADGDG